MKKPAVIFDLDGTLWDSSVNAVCLWNRVFDRYGIKDNRMDMETISGLMGKTMREIGEKLFPSFSEEERKRIIDEYSSEEIAVLYKNGAQLYDGIQQTLAELSAEHDLYIVSNSQDGYVQAFLHAHGLDAYFTDFEMSGRTGEDKGRNIRTLMERNGIEKAVYVGDTRNDEQAAEYAGIPFIWASYGFGEASAPDAMIADISDLPQCVSQLFEIYSMQ